MQMFWMVYVKKAAVIFKQRTVSWLLFEHSAEGALCQECVGGDKGAHRSSGDNVWCPVLTSSGQSVHMKSVSAHETFHPEPDPAACNKFYMSACPTFKGCWPECREMKPNCRFCFFKVKSKACTCLPHPETIHFSGCDPMGVKKK